MRLYEEYLERHSLDMLSAKCVESGSFLIRSVQKEGGLTYKGYLLFSIEWHDLGKGEPGKFTISSLRPKHNGHESVLFKIVGEDQVEWDEYEKHLFDLLEIVSKRDLVLEGRRVELAFWNIFLYCCDSLIAERGYYQRFFPTVDSELSLTDRYLEFRNALRFLESHDPKCWRIWKTNIADRIRNYCHWIGDLVNEKTLIC